MSKKKKRKRGKITKFFSTTESNQLMNNIQILNIQNNFKNTRKFNLTSCVGINRVGFSLPSTCFHSYMEFANRSETEADGGIASSKTSVNCFSLS